MFVKEKNMVNVLLGKALITKECIKDKIFCKKPGDGQYVSAAVLIIISLAVGGLVYSVLTSGNTNIITQAISKIGDKLTTFIDKITG